MDEDGDFSGEHIVRVGGGDGEVVGEGGVGSGPINAGDGGGGSGVGGEELVAGLEGVGWLPLLVAVVPEGVVFGGRDAGAVFEFQVDDGVAVDPYRQDRFGRLLSGLGVGGQHLVACLDLADRLDGSVGHQDAGVTVETADGVPGLDVGHSVTPLHEAAEAFPKDLNCTLEDSTGLKRGPVKRHPGARRCSAISETIDMVLDTQHV